jgi:iron complex outermembrane receptor protein
MSAKRSAGAKRSLTFLNTLLLASAFSVPAFAQIETVVVTAEKRAQDVQTVPIAISVFSSEKRDAIGINSIQDMTNFTPGLQYNTSTDRVSLRGVGRQTNVLSADAAVANYDDGMYETFAVAAGRSSLDLERVEVLRGPQGTLSGRNAIAGALNEITRRPNADAFEGEFRATYGNFNHLTAEGRLSGPITDQYAYGLYIVWDKQTEGWMQNIVPGSPDEGGVLNDIYIDGQFQAKWNSHFEMWTKFQTAKWFNGAGNAGSQSGGWTPSDSPTYEFGVAATGLNPGYGCTAIPGGTGFTANTTAFGAVSPVADPCRNPATDSPWQRQRLVPYNVKLPAYYSVNSQWTWHTDSNFDVKYVFGATYYDYRLTGPASPGAGSGVDQYAPVSDYFVHQYSFLPGGTHISGEEAFLYREENSFYSNEINLISTGDSPVQWVVGAYQFQQHYYQPVLTHDENQAQWNNGTPAFGVPGALCFETGGVCPATVDHRRFDNRPANQATSYAGFGQVDWQVNDEWKVTLGARYSWDRKYGHESVRLICFAVPACFTAPEFGQFFPLPAVDLTQLPSVVDAGALSHAGALPKGVVANTTYDPATGFATREYNANWSAVSGNAGVEWQPDQDTNVYLKYGRGYKSGGFNIGIFTVLSFQPWTDKETVDSFELGAKKTWNDWLTTNAAIFYYKYHDLQIPLAVIQSAGGLAQSETAFLNIPESVSQGFELESTITPIDNLAILFNYSYNDAHVTEGVAADPADPGATAPGAQPLFDTSSGPNGCINHLSPGPDVNHPLPTCAIDAYTLAAAPDPSRFLTNAAGTFVGWNIPQSLKGNDLPNAARNKVAVNLLYTWETTWGTFTPSVSYVWRDAQYGTLFTRSYTKAPSWDQVDGRIRWKSEDDTYEIIVFGKNLTGNIGYDAGAYGTRMAGSIITNSFVPCDGGSVTSTTYNIGTGPMHQCNFVQGVNGPTGYNHIRGTDSRGIASTYSITPPTTYGIEFHYKFD